MKRKKPVKRKYIQNLGGYLVGPPKHCPFKKVDENNVFWTDLVLCHSYCPKKCRRYKWFCNATGDEKRARWKKYRVKYSNLLFKGER